MSEYKYINLSQAARFSDKRIKLEFLTLDTYVSTENMIPDKGGVTTANNLPKIKTVPKFKKNDILLSNIRPYFKKIYLAKDSGGCSNDVLVLEINEKFNKKFIYYVLSDNNFFNYATVTSKGTKMPRGSKSAIMKYLVPDISIEKQNEIVNILSTYDNLIQNNNHRIELLDQMAQNLYKEWFVRMRFPGHETTKFVNGIPDGWELNLLGEKVNITSSKRIYESDYVSEGIPFYRSKEIITLSSNGLLSNVLYISPTKYEEIKVKYDIDVVYNYGHKIRFYVY